MQQFHYQSDYYSEQEMCPALDMGDERGTYNKTLEVWTPLTVEAANAYWEKCDCGLREVVDSILTAREEEADNNMRNVGY